MQVVTPVIYKCMKTTVRNNSTFQHTFFVIWLNIIIFMSCASFIVILLPLLIIIKVWKRTEKQFSKVFEKPMWFSSICDFLLAFSLWNNTHRILPIWTEWSYCILLMRVAIRCIISTLSTISLHLVLGNTNLGFMF